MQEFATLEAIIYFIIVAVSMIAFMRAPTKRS